MKLITKTRKINTLLQQATGRPVDFTEMSETLSEVIGASVFVADADGELLGFAANHQIEDEDISTMINDRQLPADYTQNLLTVVSTSSNIDINSEYTIFPVENNELFKNALTTIIPITSGGERLGTLILGRLEGEFQNEDLFLGEYGATVVGMEILRRKSEIIAEDTRNKAIVQMAIHSLSYSETEAIEYIFAELNGTEGLLVASRVADRYGITRSVIVNALRKLESAGVIESRSLGMKGTFIKVLNNKFLSELKKVTSGNKLFA